MRNLDSFITRNHYLSLAENQNNQEAQYFLLGFIYYSVEYVTRDIKKSIYYMSLAANKNESEVQFFSWNNLSFKLIYRARYE